MLDALLKDLVTQKITSVGESPRAQDEPCSLTRVRFENISQSATDVVLCVVFDNEKVCEKCCRLVINELCQRFLSFFF